MTCQPCQRLIFVTLGNQPAIHKSGLSDCNIHLHVNILSDRFLQDEGGIERLVWLPSLVKEELKDRLVKKLTKLGHPDLFEKIADETKATSLEELIAFLDEVQHPALTMKPLL